MARYGSSISLKLPTIERLKKVRAKTDNENWDGVINDMIDLVVKEFNWDI